MSTIVFKNVSKVYEPLTKKDKRFKAVVDFNLEIQDEEFIVFVGPSGCGKSTTLRMLAGLEEITGGEISINGRVINKVHPKDRDIAMVFQNYALYPHMTVFQNMAFSLKLKHMSKEEIRKKVTEAADILGLTTLLDRKPKALSGGQRQRVALGRAIVRDPAVFLMDEPLSNLDAKLRVQTRTEISKLHKKLKATCIYVTHDQVEAMTMGTRIVVLNGGVIQQVGTPAELFHRPANMFVAGFIGSPAMNMIKVDVVLRNGNTTLALQNGAEVLLTAPKAAAVAPYVGKTVIMGIRPEHIHHYTGTDRNASQGQLCVKADMVEVLGSDEVVYFTLDGNSCAAKAIESGVTAESDVCFTIDLEKVHLFDPETKLTITN